MLIGADLVRAVALVAIPLAAWQGALSLPLLYAIAAITGIATVLFELADHVFITDLVGRDQLLDANGKREAVDAVAEISGPALGGALVAWLTAPIAIAVDAATFVASALLIARIRKRETIVAPPAGASLLDDVRTGIHVVWRDPAIRALFVAAATMTLFGSFMASLYTLFALPTLGLTPARARHHDRLRRYRRARRCRAVADRVADALRPAANADRLRWRSAPRCRC